MLESRPIIKPPLSLNDKVVEVVSSILMITTWILTLSCYTYLPDTIPIHYNFKGAADGYGDKSTVFILPSIATLLFLLLTVLNKYPHIFNYPTKITENNALRQYTIATKMLRCLKLIISIIFGFISYKIMTYSSSIGVWFIPILFIILAAVLSYFIIKSLGAIKNH